MTFPPVIKCPACRNMSVLIDGLYRCPCGREYDPANLTKEELLPFMEAERREG